jgi:hypothetical protein
MQWITKKAYDNKAANRTELLTYYITNFGTAVIRGWVASFIFRDAAELFEKKIENLKCRESSLKL